MEKVGGSNPLTSNHDLYLIFIFSSLCVCETCILFTDQLEFNERNAEIIIEDSTTTFNYQGINLKCRNLKAKLDEKLIVVDGESVIDDGANKFTTKKIKLKENEISLYDVSGKFKDWFVNAKLLKSKTTEEYILRNCKFTTCTKRKPHYYFSSSRAKVKPKKNISAKNITFYIWKIPLFYIPFYSYSLREKGQSLNIQPGFKNEPMIRFTYNSPFMNYSYWKLHLDYFITGYLGKGIEFNSNYKGKFIQSLYGYHIKDEFRERWNFRAGLIHNLKGKLITSGNINLMSDRSFSNLYFSEDWNWYYNRIFSHLQTVYRRGGITAKLLFQRIDEYTGRNFEMRELTIPYFNFYIYPTTVKGFIVSSSFTSSYKIFKGGEGVFSSQMSTNLMKNFKITRYLSFTPKLNLIYDLKDKFEYSSVLNLKNRVSRDTTVDLAYEFSTIQKNELLKLITYSFFHEKFALRIYSAYDLILNEFQPLSTDVFIDLKKISFHIRPTITYDKPFLISAISSIKLSLPKQEEISITSFLNKLPDREEYDAVIGLKKWLTKGMYLNTSTILSFQPKIRVEYAFGLYFDLHCWEANFSYKRRRGLEEFFITFGLKIGRQAREKLVDRNLERQFYPWR